MITTVEVTGRKSQCIDTECAYLYMVPPRTLGPILTLEFWGLVLRDLKSREHPGSNSQENSGTIVIPSWAHIRFEEPVLFEISVALYKEANTSFLHDDRGEAVCLERSMLRGSPEGSYQYDLGGYLLWPKGDAEITIRAIGKVIVEFDGEGWMTAREFERRVGEMEFPS